MEFHFWANPWPHRDHVRERELDNQNQYTYLLLFFQQHGEFLPGYRRDRIPPALFLYKSETVLFLNQYISDELLLCEALLFLLLQSL